MIDPNIALQTRAVPVQSPMTTLGQVMNLRNAQMMQERHAMDMKTAKLNQDRLEMENAARMRAAGDDGAIREALTQSGGDPEQAIKALRGTNVQAAMKLAGVLQSQRIAQTKQEEQTIKNHAAAMHLQSQVLQGVKDEETFQAAKSIAKKIDPNTDVDAAMGDHYDPKRVEALLSQGETLQEHNTRTHNALLHYQWAVEHGMTPESYDEDGNPHFNDKSVKANTTAAAGILSQATSQKDWDQRMAGLKARFGEMAPDVLNGFDTVFTKDSPKRAAAMGMTPQQSAELGVQVGRLQEYSKRTSALNARTATANAGKVDPYHANDMAEYNAHLRQEEAANPRKGQTLIMPGGSEVMAPRAEPKYKDFDDWRQQVHPDHVPGAGKKSAAAPADLTVQFSNGKKVTFKDKASMDAGIAAAAKAKITPVTTPKAGATPAKAVVGAGAAAAGAGAVMPMGGAKPDDESENEPELENDDQENEDEAAENQKGQASEDDENSDDEDE